MALEIGSSRFEVVESRFRLYEAQLHQPTRRIVHVDEQCASRSPVFEPFMVTAVDLNQLAEARSAMPGLMNATRPPRAGYPELDFDHPAPQRLDRDLQAVLLVELLRGQSRTEVRIAGPNERQGALTKYGGQLPITRSSSFLRNEPLASIDPELPAQSLDLSHAPAQLLSGQRLGQPPHQHAAEYIQKVQFFGAHRQGSQFVHVDLQTRHGGAWKPTLAKSTETVNDSLIENHLVPFFGAMDLRHIGEPDLIKFTTEKMRSGLSSATCKNALSILRRVCSLQVSNWGDYASI
jgi:hypothetical protein